MKPTCTMILALGAVVCTIALAPEPAAAYDAYGIRACVERCFAHECGEAGVGCPTQAQKHRFRAKCTSVCAKTARDRELRRRARAAYLAYQRRRRLQQDRARSYRRRLILRHNLWMARRKQAAAIKISYQRALSEGRVARARVFYQQMRLREQEAYAAARQREQMKSQFYSTRVRLQHQLALQMAREVNQHELAMARARKAGQTAKVKRLAARIQHKKAKIHAATAQKAKFQSQARQAVVRGKKFGAQQHRAKAYALEAKIKQARKKGDTRRATDLAASLQRVRTKEKTLTLQAHHLESRIKPGN